MNKNELTRIFAALGADDAERWAASEIDEGIPQLARFLFLKGCWENIIPDDNSSWIDKIIADTPRDSNAPYAGTAHSLRRLVEGGARPDDICEVVRGMQAELVFGICYQMADPGAVSGNRFVSWGLFETDEDGNVGREINGLHESVLETDPTGREMRPKQG